MSSSAAKFDMPPEALDAMTSVDELNPRLLRSDNVDGLKGNKESLNGTEDMICELLRAERALSIRLTSGKIV